MPLAYRLQTNNHYYHRLMVIFLTCAPTFVILTLSYEALFYVSFSALLVIWVALEHRLQLFTRAQARGKLEAAGSVGLKATTSASPLYRPLTLGDARIALFFLVLLQSAFFSTGNVASVSSFS